MHDERQHSLFLRNGFRYAVPIGLVREVVMAQRILASPLAKPGFVGFLDFRSSFCPVIDLPAWIDMKVPEVPADPCLVIVLGVGESIFAIRIDKFLANAILEEPLGSSNDKVVDRLYRQDGEAVHRLDTRVLVDWIAKELQELREAQKEEIAVLAAPVEEAELIGFTLAGLNFALPIVDLTEVIEGYTVEPLFRVDPFLRGLVNLRGQILACVDLSAALGAPPRLLEEKNQFLVLQGDGLDLALCIDQVSHKLRIPNDRVSVPGEIMMGELSEYLRGIIETTEQRIFVLSGAQLFSSRHLAAYRE